MADHIKIDTSMLADMATNLKSLHDDFAGSSDLADHYSGSMGSKEVADAMHNFATDWKKKREELTGNLDTLAKAADSASRTWDGVDRDLAKALTDDGSQNGGK